MTHSGVQLVTAGRSIKVRHLIFASKAQGRWPDLGHTEGSMKALVLDPAQCWLLSEETPDGGSEGLLSENAECAENAEIAET